MKKDEPKGKAKGGVARAAALSDERKKEIAVKAARARWGEKPPQATHKGNFKDDFGFDVDCYVLNDENKTAVISQRGMGAALGFSSQGGGRLTRFMEGKNIAPYIGLELRGKLENPLIFQGSMAVSGTNPTMRLHGFDVTILIDLCKAVVNAQEDGKLAVSQKKLAKQAHIILNASAKAGIRGLVYALSGYDATREEVVAAFKLYVREEAREYEKEFSDQLYQQWYRLYKIPKPARNKPWKFKHLTIDHVYTPLARSNGKIHELAQVKRTASGEKSKRLHQFLTQIGVKALRQHLGQLLGIAQVSEDKEEYEKHVNKIFGDQQRFNF